MTDVVPAALRDLVRGALELASHADIAAARRSHADRVRVLALYGIT